MKHMTAVRQLHTVRLVTSDDTDVLLGIDSSYSAAFGLDVTASRGSASFHARTGHSFLAEQDGDVRGFVFANAIWTGGRPTVRLERLAVEDPEDLPARLALLDALIKSAYDAGVYDLLAELPAADSTGAEALAANGFTDRPVRNFGLVLGSRGTVKQ